jgi:flagellar M-ring protein FliF
MSMVQIPFVKAPKTETPATGPVPPAAMGALKYVGLGLGLLAFLFFVTRHLRRREREALMDEPTWLREIESRTTVAALEAGRSSIPLLPPDQRGDPGSARRKVGELAQREPETVAAQVRSWMGAE